MSRLRTSSRLLLPLLLLVAVVAAACGSSDSGGSGSGESSSTTGGKASTEPVTLRLGYFPNVTHAPALVGIEGGLFDESLGANVTLETTPFNAGPDVITAIYSGALDASFIGPSPTISGFQKSDGEALRVVAGAASGGAYLVTRPDITKPADLLGKKLSTPQLGNTQDVALRTWLQEHDLTSDTSGGGDVSIVPQENSLTLTAFQQGQIDGAWVPEPWATRLVQEGGGKILVDERDLWPGGRYVTTNLIVRTGFLDEHPDVVEQLLEGELAAIELIATNPTEAKRLTGEGIEKGSGKALKPDLIDASFENITFTVDPIASSLRKNAQDAVDVGLAPSADVDGIYDLSVLNRILKAEGKPTVKS
jgi:NitT/TauT family transport system substrate-binding protein